MFSLWFMVIRAIFRVLPLKTRNRATLAIAFLVLFIERIRKGQVLDWYEVGNGGDFHVPALRCIYNIMKTCSEQSSYRDFYTLLLRLEPF